MSAAVRIWLGVLFLAVLSYVGYLAMPRQAVEVSTPVKIKPGESPVDLTKFTMTERSGQEFNFEQLKGTIWVANTFFASCPHQCRALNTAVDAMQRLPDFADVKFVSISVDPVVDTPEGLAEYADTFSADKERWLFMNGKLKDVRRFGEEMGVKTGYREHTQQLVVFDHTGRYRGGFQFDSESEVQEMRELLLKLLEEKQQSES